MSLISPPPPPPYAPAVFDMGSTGQIVLPGPDTAASSGYSLSIDLGTLTVTRSEGDGTCTSGTATCNAGDEGLAWVITVDRVQRMARNARNSHSTTYVTCASDWGTPCAEYALSLIHI